MKPGDRVRLLVDVAGMDGLPLGSAGDVLDVLGVCGDGAVEVAHVAELASFILEPHEFVAAEVDAPPSVTPVS